MKSRNLSWVILAAAIALLAVAYDLDGYPLLDPDEGRNAEVAREMAAGNDYVLPRLNGLPYLDKPALFFAVEAALMEVMGPTVLAARLPSLIFTLATLIVVAWFGKRHIGLDGGLVAAVATATTPFTLAYARTVIFDSTLTFFMTVAIVGFYEAVGRMEGQKDGELKVGRDDPSVPPTFQPSPGNEAGSRGTYWSAIAWAAVALGVLTKGPVALALPLMIGLPFAISRRASRAVADPIGILLFAVILMPWLIAMSRRIPEFLEYALVTETLVRLTTPALGRSEPWWYFLLILPAAALPWTVVVLSGWRAIRDRIKQRDALVTLLTIWIAVPLIFFSLSNSKRPQYILPLIPAIGLLVGLLAAKHKGRFPGARAAGAFLCVLGAGLIGAHRWIPAMVAATPAIATTIPQTAVALGLICVACGTGAWWFAAERMRVVLILCLPVACIPFISRALMDEIGVERSAQPVAEAVGPLVTPASEIVAIEAFPLSLPFYLRRTLTVATHDARVMTSNYLMRHHERWRRESGTTLRPGDWWLEALAECPRPTLFIVQSADRRARPLLDSRLELLIDTGRYAAYGPCGSSGLASRPPLPGIE